MTIHCLLFSALREAAGVSRLDLELPDGMTVESAFEYFCQTHVPGGRSGAPNVMYAVAEEYVPAHHVLKAGDEVAFIPPVAGG